MGELDMTVAHLHPDFIWGIRYVFLTVFLTWIPLAIAGLVLARNGRVHAAMRGAMPLRALARSSMAIQVGAMAFPLMFFTEQMHMAWRFSEPWPIVFLTLAIGLCVLLPIAAIGFAGIIAWHRVLDALTSREGEGRMLV